MQYKGWIVYNGQLSSPVFLDYAQSLHNAAKKYNIETKLLKNNELLSYISTDNLSVIPTKLTLPDFVIFTDKDIYLANQLERLGIRLFNCARSIELSDDKILTYDRLARNNLAIPQTITAPKSFTRPQEADLSYVQDIIDILGFPMIIKEAFGSFGEQVHLAYNYQQIIDSIQQIGHRPFMFQEFIKTSYGKDMRLQVVGNQVVAAMIRSSKHDFRSNITAGGLMESYNPTQSEKNLAIAATAAIEADFAGVDLLYGEKDKPVICEVNSNAHIRNLFECTRINVADDIIQYIMQYFSRNG